MAIYRCFECDKMVDNDWNPCEEHPTKDNELVCPSCFEEYEDMPEPSLEVKQGGVFTPEQQAQIRRMEQDIDDEY